MITIPQSIEPIFKILEAAHYQCYLVGGFVRDALLNKNSKDIDISTNAMPDHLMRIFSAYSPKAVYPYGINFKYDMFNVEITTMRFEPKHQFGRHPKTIEYTDKIEIDALRRDFTMNALYFSPTKGLIDPLNGFGDIQNHIIKSIGNPVSKILDDPIRMLRAFSFQSKLGFHIDASLLEAISGNLKSIDSIALSQKSKYIRTIVSGRYFKSAYESLPPLMDMLLPFECLNDNEEIVTNEGKLSKNIFVVAVVSSIEADFYTKLAALLYSYHNLNFEQTKQKSYCFNDAKSKESIRNYMESLSINKKHQNFIFRILDALDVNRLEDVRDMQRFVYEYGLDVVKASLDILSATECVLGNKSRSLNLVDLFKTIIDKSLPIEPSDLSVKSMDLVAVGIPVEHTRACLHYAFASYLANALVNERSAIINFCLEVYNELFTTYKSW